MMKKNPGIRPWMLRKELIILYYAFGDKKTPLTAMIPAILGLVYFLSPIDLFPDFIPLFGYLDDVVIVPLLLNLSIRLLPAHIKQESILRAERNNKKFKLLIFAVILLLLGWILGIFMLARHIINNY